MPTRQELSPSPVRKTMVDAALSELNNAVSSNTSTTSMLSSVAVQLGGENHPYKFSRKDPEFVVLISSSAAAITTDAVKLGIRCYDENNRQIVKEELAARVFAVHKGSMKEPEWFEPSFFGSNAGEYWKPKFIGLFKGLVIITTMFIVNYGRAYYAREWNCYWVSVAMHICPIMCTDPSCAPLRHVHRSVMCTVPSCAPFRHVHRSALSCAPLRTVMRHYPTRPAAHHVQSRRYPRHAIVCGSQVG